MNNHCIQHSHQKSINLTFLSTKISSTIDLGDLGIVHMFITRTTIFQVSFWSSILAIEFNLRNNATQVIVIANRTTTCASYY